MKPITIHDLLRLLETYHQRRRDTYHELAAHELAAHELAAHELAAHELAARCNEPRTVLLLNQFVRFEQDAVRFVQDDLRQVQPDRAAYLPSGPMLTVDPSRAMDCQCDADSTLTSDEALDEVIDRLAGSSPVESVQTLASRLHELERTKDRQIAKFTRED